MKYSSFVFFAIFSFSAVSGTNLDEDKKVKLIQTYANGTIGITTEGMMINPAKCSSALKYVLDASEGGVSNVLSVLLSAKVADRPVDLYIDNDSCASGYPVISSVVMK